MHLKMVCEISRLTVILIKTRLRWWVGRTAERHGILTRFLSELESMFQVSSEMAQIFLNSLAIQKLTLHRPA